MKKATILILFILAASVASACAPALPITDPAEVLQAFYDELNAGDVGGAMEYVSESEDTSFVFEIRLSDKADIGDFYQREADRNSLYELTDIEVDGDTINFTLIQKSDILAESSHRHSALVEEGKLVKHLRL